MITLKLILIKFFRFTAEILLLIITKMQLTAHEKSIAEDKLELARPAMEEAEAALGVGVCCSVLVVCFMLFHSCGNVLCVLDQHRILCF